MSYFPLLVLLVKEGRQIVAYSFADIPNEAPFVVLRSQYVQTEEKA